MSESVSTEQTNGAQNGGLHELEAVRSILLSLDRKQIEKLEAETKTEISALLEKIEQLQQQVNRLETSKADEETLIPTIQNELSEITGHAVQSEHRNMANALGPVIGEATRVQIRQSRSEMSTALAPILGEIIVESIQDSIRELQKNIDARLNAESSPLTILKRFQNRLRGVKSSELAMRQALPFNLIGSFLIQQGSGLLISQSAENAELTPDSDLVSGMLTAIKDFVGDAFAVDGDLDNISQGDQTIIIKGGKDAYCAVVIEGVEPEGFRSKLKQFVTNLHLMHGEELAAYDGDPSTITNFVPALEQLGIDLSTISATARNEGGASSVGKRIVQAGIGCLSVFLLLSIGLICYSSWRLMPIVINGLPTPHPTQVVVITATPAPTLIPTETAVPTAIPTNTPLPSPTATDEPTATPLPTSTPTSTPEPTLTPTSIPPSPTPLAFVEVTTNSSIWARNEPSLMGTNIFIIPIDSTVKALAKNNEWYLLEYVDALGVRQGWVNVKWLNAPIDFPVYLVTPET